MSGTRRTPLLCPGTSRGGRVRRTVIALLLGALVSMGLGVAASGAHSPSPAVAAEVAAAAASAPADPNAGLNCYSLQKDSGATLDLCDHGPDVAADVTLDQPLASYPQYDTSAL